MMTSVPGFQNSQTFLWLLNDFANKFHDFPMLFLGVISHKASFHEAFEKRMLTEKKNAVLWLEEKYEGSTSFSY